MACKGLKICMIVTATIIILAVAIFFILYFTILKPKDPLVSVHPVGLKDLEFISEAPSTPLKMIITIKNPNYGIFMSEKSTGYLRYHDTVIAEIPLKEEAIPGHATTNVTTTAALKTRILLSDDSFLKDLEDNTFNLTAKSTMPGKVHMLQIIKVKATVSISCDILFNITAMTSDSNCVTKIKLP